MTDIADPFIAAMLRRKDEPLDPELAPHVSEVSFGEFTMPALRHPLVYLVPFLPGEAFRANELLKHKREQMKRARKERDNHTLVFLYERPYRAEALLAALDAGRFPRADAGEAAYWSLVAEVWIDSENIDQVWHAWRHLWRPARLPTTNRLRLASGEKAYAELMAMPEELTVYHGQGVGDTLDWSWTLDRDEAVWFARRFGVGVPEVLTGKVSRSNIYAYLTGRGEAEIVAPQGHVEVVSRSSA